MDAITEQEKAAPSRHGSETRQRTHSVRVRLDDAERALLEVKAGEAGLSLAAYMRSCSLGEAGPRARRSPVTDRKEIAGLRVDIARIGNNLNQLTRAVNQNQIPDIIGLEESLELVRRVSARCMTALGFASHDC